MSTSKAVFKFFIFLPTLDHSYETKPFSTCSTLINTCPIMTVIGIFLVLSLLLVWVSIDLRITWLTVFGQVCRYEFDLFINKCNSCFIIYTFGFNFLFIFLFVHSFTSAFSFPSHYKGLFWFRSVHRFNFPCWHFTFRGFLWFMTLAGFIFCCCYPVTVLKALWNRAMLFTFVLVVVLYEVKDFQYLDL